MMLRDCRAKNAYDSENNIKSLPRLAKTDFMKVRSHEFLKNKIQQDTYAKRVTQ